MKTCNYYVLNARDVEDWESVNTKAKAFKAAEEVIQEGLYEPVILKVVKLPVEIEKETV